MTYLKILHNQLLSHPYTKPAAFVIIIGSILWMLINFITGIALITYKPDTKETATVLTDLSMQVNNQLNQIPTWHLFGQTPPTAKNAAQIPLSDLNIMLIGVFLKSDAALSKALITDPGGSTKYYRIGDMIPGGVTLFNILPDAIVIKRDGELEKIMLPNRQLNFSPPPLPKL